MKAWGTPNSGPGDFDLVHSVAVDSGAAFRYYPGWMKTEAAAQAKR